MYVQMKTLGGSGVKEREKHNKIDAGRSSSDHSQTGGARELKKKTPTPGITLEYNLPEQAKGSSRKKNTYGNPNNE